MKKYRILYGAILCVALVSFVVTDRAASLALLCLLAALPIVTLLVQLAAMGGLTLRCAVRPACHVGQTVSFVITLRRRSRLPLGVVNLDGMLTNTLYGDQTPVFITLQPGESREQIFEYHFHAQDCGVVRAKGLQMECYDLLGLFCWRRAVDTEVDLRVYPAELKVQTELSQRPETKNFGTMYDPYKRGQDVSEVSGLRDYVPGDAIHSIHWKLSEKLNKTIVREFGKPTDYNTLILYELANSSGGKPISHARNNVVLALTLALSYSMLELGLEHEVGLVYQHQLQTAPVGDMQAFERVKDDILYIPVSQKDGSMDTAFVFLRGNASTAYTKLVYITPVYQEQSLRQLANVADLAVLHVVEDQEQSYASGTSYTVLPVNVNTYEQSFNHVVL